MESLKEKTAKGLFWGGLNNIILQVIGMAFGIILPRLLAKSDYGMLAMISVFSLIATALQDSGFKTAIVNLKEATPRDYNSVFWFNIIMGISLYTILFFCAPLIAEYYHTASLTPFCRFAFLSILISSFGTAQSAYLFRNLMAKQLAKCGMLSAIISSTATVIMAFYGFAYWALAAQGLIFVSLNTIMMWHYSKWRPIFEIDFGPVRRMFRFSVKMLATTIINHINNNIMNILLGRYFSTTEVGTYNQAYQWDSKGFYIVQGMLNQVAQPVLANMNNEQERQLRILRKMMRFTCFISFPLMFGLALVSREFIIVAITVKWLDSAILLQLLCISGAFMPIYTLLYNLIISKGKSGICLWSTVVFGILQISMMISLYPYGIHSMVIAYVILNISWIFVWQFFARRLTGYGYLSMLKDTVPFLLTAVGVMALTYLVTMSIQNLVILLIARVIIAALLYYSVMRIAHVEILDECMNFIRSKFKKEIRS